MGKFIKSRDPKAIVHYENAHLEFKAVPIGENYSDISDVESRMYAPLDYTAEYNNSSLNATGLATATDSLAAIRKAVFEDKTVTLGEFG